MLSHISLPLVLAAGALSMPTLSGRQTGASCAGLGSGATDTISYNFTFAAYNLDTPNANSTGAPLVLGWGPGGDDPAASAWALSTYASWGSNEWPYISLEGGSLFPEPGPDEDGLGAYNFATTAGDEVIFYVTEHESAPETADIWCAVPDSETDYSILAVNGDTSNFSLCDATTTWISGTQVNLVYSPAENNTDYVYDTCTPVRVQLVPYSD